MQRIGQNLKLEPLKMRAHLECRGPAVDDDGLAARAEFCRGAPDGGLLLGMTGLVLFEWRTHQSVAGRGPAALLQARATPYAFDQPLRFEPFEIAPDCRRRRIQLLAQLLERNESLAVEQPGNFGVALGGVHRVTGGMTRPS